MTGKTATKSDAATRLGTEADVHRLVEERLTQREPQVELLAVEVSSVRGSGTVRIFLDSAEGVTLEDCARVTGHLNDLLHDYSVEVSSPGPKRPLTKARHFERFLGCRARIRTTDKIEGRNDFKGELLAATDEEVTLAGAWGTVVLAYDQIRRANLLPDSEGGS